MKKVLPAPWAYSKLKAFETCPKQFYHEKVLREFPFRETPEIRFGNRFHKAAELLAKESTPLPKEFKFAEGTLAALLRKPGLIHAEMKMGVTANLDACGFFDSDVWLRGVVDLAIINEDHAFVVDYKTGKSHRYADTGQLELMALLMFAKYPQLERISAGLVYVISKGFIKRKYTRDDIPRLWESWTIRFRRMVKAFDSEVWNPNPSGLCKRHCPVVECPHNGANG